MKDEPKAAEHSPTPESENESWHGESKTKVEALQETLLRCNLLASKIQRLMAQDEDECITDENAPNSARIIKINKLPKPKNQ